MGTFPLKTLHGYMGTFPLQALHVYISGTLHSTVSWAAGRPDSWTLNGTHAKKTLLDSICELDYLKINVTVERKGRNNMRMHSWNV